MDPLLLPEVGKVPVAQKNNQSMTESDTSHIVLQCPAAQLEEAGFVCP